MPTPKAILFTTYHIKDNTNTILDEKLLVVNIHAILLSRKYLYMQLENMVNHIDKHKGPVILAGDFNTMTSSSYLKLVEVIKNIGMSEVKIGSALDNRVLSFMGQYYDMVFYKHLELVRSHAIDLKTSQMGKTSDHNPIFVEFKTLKAKSNEADIFND
jgi:endonuclease/exonuclease/phosphatase (EEP) superfamily protein YafD